MAPSTPAPTLDHIVLLVPHPALADIPSWLSDALTILPGGRHANGATENALVIFPDGVYIEIIAFVPGAPPADRTDHRWGRLAEGQVVDWALSLLVPDHGDKGEGTPEQVFVPIQDRVRQTGSGFLYADPAAGGRVRPDGVELKWAVAAPEVQVGDGKDPDPVPARGKLPFWCLDRTPRDLRVPYRQPENVGHPSGAIGVAGVTVWVRGSEEFQRLRKAYNAILDKEAELIASAAAGPEASWSVEVPSPQAKQSSKLVLKELVASAAQPRDQPADLVIEFSLFTKGAPGQIQGHIGSGVAVKIDLIAAE